MRFVRSLAVRLLAALLVPEVVEWYVVAVAFPLSDAQRQVAGVAVPSLRVVTTAAILLAAAKLAAPIGRALARGRDARGVERRHAAHSARALPRRLAALMLLLGGVPVVAVFGLELRLGVPIDLALAAAGASAAFDLMAAMLGYSIAAGAAAPAVVELTAGTAGEDAGSAGAGPFPVELAGRGTMRGKLLVICYGLLAIVTLLVGSVGYARRADMGSEAFWRQASFLGLAVFLATALLIWLAASSLTVPLGYLAAAAGRIASGDLTAQPPSVSRDELGQLAADFRRMAQGLAALVTEVQAASRGVQDGSVEMDEIGRRVKGGAREEYERVLAVKAAVEGMQESVALVGRGVEGLAGHVRSTSSAVGETAAALEEVRRQAADLERRAEAAGADVDELSGAGRRAQARIGALAALAGSAQGTLGSVSASLSGLETSAIASQLASAQAAEMADTAEEVVREAVSGIESLRSAVDDAKSRVTVLGRRSDDVDQILDFIGEVAGRTNLLSLNASIIATRAGEHGKAFAVVAGQIRELAAQITSSTRSVGDIIRAVRDDVSGTAHLIERGDELAAEGVARARRSLDALREVRMATARGHEAAASIRDAVQEHARSTRDVSVLVTAVSDDTGTLSEAMQMVGRSVAAVGPVTRGVGALADEVSRALEEQSGLGRSQLESLERIERMMAGIARAVESHDRATRRVREVLAQLDRTAEQHESSVIELSRVADRLGSRSRALADRVGRFKI